MQSKSIHLVLIIFLISAFSVVQVYTALTWGIPAYHSWAVDSQGGVKILSWVKGGMRYEGFDGRYPPMHKYLLAATYAPIVLYYWLAGKIDSHGMTGIGVAEKNLRTLLISAGRLLTIIMAIGIILIIYRIGNIFGQHWAGLFASGLWCCNYLVLYYSMTTNLDVPYLFWSLFAFERLLKFRLTGRTRLLVLSAMLSALAVGTKDQAAGIILAFPILLFLPLRYFERPRNLNSIKKISMHAVVFILLSLIMYGIISQAFLRPANFVEHIRIIFGEALTPYKSNMSWSEGIDFFASQFWRSVHPATYIILIAGLIVCIKTNWRVFIWLISPIVAYHATFILPSKLLSTRFLLPHFTFLTIIAGIGFSEIFKTHQRVANILITALILFNIILGLSFNGQTLWNDSRKRADDWLKEHREVQKSIAYYCDIQAYNPTIVQSQGKHYSVRKIGRPIQVEEEYLICVSAYYSRFLKKPFEREWKDFFDNKSSFKVVQYFSHSEVNRIPSIPGVAQSIYILKKSTNTYLLSSQRRFRPSRYGSTQVDFTDS